MIDLFQTDDGAFKGEDIYPEQKRIFDNLESNLAKIVKYNSNPSRVVRSNNYLLRLINQFALSHEEIGSVFIASINSNMSEILNVTEIVDSNSFGEIIKKGILEGRLNEVILHTADESINEFTVEALTNQWRTLVPLKFSYHPYTDLNFNLIDTKEEKRVASDIIFFNLDIRMLLVKWRGFMIEQNKIKDKTKRESERHFIYSEVLTPALDSYVKISLFNRIYAIQTGAPIEKSIRRETPPLLNVENDINESYAEVVDDLISKNVDWDRFMDSIKIGNNADLRDIKDLPMIPLTEQCFWAAIYPKLKILNFILNHFDATDNDLDRASLVRIERTFRTFITGRAEKSITNLEFRARFKKEIDAVVARL